VRIYKMTATFGKLRHETLTLEPGLNIIQAPNEWGKSTWCAFLIAMLYGLDTRTKTTKSALADKERYAPWSGELMSGRIDLNWRGRDITIERSTRRRIPLGEFKAYETASGLPVPELTGTNCGQWLLGVEQSVFRRAGFIRFSDLPVTQDEALRARLNALVTTGDESGHAEALASALKDLKNHCRYNKKGLLPQAEEQLAELDDKLREQEELTGAMEELRRQLEELERQQHDHENHLAALEYAQARAGADRVAQAKEKLVRAEEEVLRCQEAVDGIPGPEQTREKRKQLQLLAEDFARLEAEPVPEPPEAPELPVLYQGEAPREMVEQDRKRYKALGRKPVLWWAASGILALAGIVLALMKLWIWGVAALGLGCLVLALSLMLEVGRREKKLVIQQKYANPDPDTWMTPLEDHQKALGLWQSQTEEVRKQQGILQERHRLLERRREELCGELTPERAMEVCDQISSRWEALDRARQERDRAQNHYAALKEVAKQLPPEPEADTLECSREESKNWLAQAQENRWNLQNRLGRYQGRAQSIGARENLEQERGHLLDRIRKLEDAYAALTIAQETLAQARLELQRRFAPQIVKRARELMGLLTCGRYDKLGLKEDLSITAAAGEEDMVRELLWRSDGTVDQLYLALRLAVAEALAPEAPLVLDDALVRFDDNRLKAALQVLQGFGADRQVLIFTCHSRERTLLNK